MPHDRSLNQPLSPAQHAKHVRFRRFTADGEGTATLGYAPSFSDPSSTGTIASAVLWLEETLLGTIGTTVTVISVTSASGTERALQSRRAAAAIVGCFILFGASSIVAGLQGMARGGGTLESVPQQIVLADVSPLAPAPRPPWPRTSTIHMPAPQSDALARGVNA